MKLKQITESLMFVKNPPTVYDAIDGMVTSVSGEDLTSSAKNSVYYEIADYIKSKASDTDSIVFLGHKGNKRVYNIIVVDRFGSIKFDSSDDRSAMYDGEIYKTKTIELSKLSEMSVRRFKSMLK